MDSTLLDVLKDQIVPALGCTEPIAVALAVAKAQETLGNTPNRIKIKVDKNIYKNALAVGIPGTKEKGLYMAVALALVAGKSKYKLEVLKDVTEADVLTAKEILKDDIIYVAIDEETLGLYVEVEAFDQLGKSRVLIKNKHDNIVYVEKDGQVIFEKVENATNEASLIETIKNKDIKDFITFVEQVDLRHLDLVEQSIKMNKTIAEAGMESKYGRVLSRGISAPNMDCNDYAKYLTSTACYARMSGYPLPVMSCAGSGNLGLTAVLPVVAVGEKKKIDHETIVRAVALSLLITIYVKSHTGVLSPVCGCAIAAGLGASAAIVYLLKGTLEQIEGAIKNMVGTLSGIICDGGKPGCAFKLSASVSAALESAMMALNGIIVSSNDGIVDHTAVQTIQNMGIVSTVGMANTDETILGVMLERCPSPSGC